MPETNLPSANKPKTPQTRATVSAKMKEVLGYMVHEGLSLPQAAERAQFNRDSAVRAFKSKNAKTLYNQMVAEVKANAAQAAYLGIVHQSQTADNERLRFDAKRWVAGVDGISPVQKVQGQHQHNVQFGGFEYPDIEPIDVTPADD